MAYSESPFDWGHRYTSNPPLRSSATWVSFPFWVPIILLGILPARAVWRGWALYYQEKVHPCETCDYDLAGNTSGICPECGTAIPGGAPADQGLEA